MYRKSILFFFILITCYCTQAQSWSSTDYTYATDKMQFKATRVVPPSPDAADLGKFGNVPVSLFTGTPSVSIPLYELKGNSISLPISLSYNAAGFKPQDIASWVGLSWTLNCGGVVTRSVMGNPDNANNYFFANNNYANISADLYAQYNYIDSVQRGQKETQPDMYYYNFAGHTGKFFVRPDQTIARKEKNDLKISCTGIPQDNLGYGTSQFSIVDEQGTVYQFAATEMSLMQIDDGTSTSVPSPLGYNYPSSWFLTSITSADGAEQIQLNYYMADTAQKQYGNYIGNNSMSYNTSTLNGATSLVSNNIINPPIVTLSKKRYLQSISYLRGGQTVITVNFTLGVDLRQDLNHTDFPCERIVQAIKVYANGVLARQFNFSYSYFTNPSYLNVDHRRLRLDSLQEVAIDGSGLVKPPYKFTYNTTAVPSATISRIDHWGFYNGADNVSTLVPNYYPGNGDPYVYGGGANREPDFNSSSIALLNKITYPTGGYTSFIYEQHQAKDKITGVARAVGGVRIKQIIDYSFTNKQATIKNYQYTLTDASASGITTTPQYFNTSSWHHYSEGAGTGQYDPRFLDYYLNYISVSANSVSGLGSLQGSHVGYSRVTEFQTDANTGAQLGKTVYLYNTDGFNANDDYIGSGDLLKKTVYDLGGKIIEDETNTYNYTTGDANIPVVKVGSHTAQDNKPVLCKTVSGGNTTYTWLRAGDATTSCTSNRYYNNKYFTYGFVYICQYKQLVSQTQTKYDQLSNSSTTITRKFTYNSTAHTLPTLIEQTTTGTEEIVTSKKYAGDYTVPGTTLDNATKGIQLLQGKNMNGSEVETIQWRQNMDGSNKRYLGGLLNIYFPNMPYRQTIYRTELTAPVTTFQSSSTNGTFSYDPSYKLLGTFNYNSYGNLIEQTKAQDITRSYVWDYFHTLPTAETVNAGAGSIAYTGFETGSSGGNWAGVQTASITTGGRAGSNSYNLGATAITNILASSVQYIVSYWLRTGTVSVSTNAGAATGTAGLQYNGWTYYEHLLPAGSTTVTITGSTANIDELRLFPKDAQMTTFNYKLLTGIISQCPPDNQFSFFEYDGLNRLINVKDQAGNIVKNYKYNYGPGAVLTASVQTLYYNAQTQQNFTRQSGTCPAGTAPSTVAYVVPYGKYASSISQADANAKASADLSANGQAYANANGLCLYWNVKDSAYYSKNDCQYSQGSSVCTLTGPGSQRYHIIYIVPANTYSSTVSQAAANTLAHNDVLANGQTYANQNCWCSCTGVGQKFINGVCETGTRENSSSTLMANGTWQCAFVYVFSDGSVSQFYYEYNTSPCNVQ